MRCPNHGEIGPGSHGVCNVAVGLGPPTMVSTAYGMAPAGPRLPGICGQRLFALGRTQTAKERAAAEAEEQLNRRTCADLVHRLETVTAKADVPAILDDADELAKGYVFPGWAAAVRSAWVRLASASVFGPPTHDLMTCAVRWEARKNTVTLAFTELAREPAWLACKACAVEIDEGADSLTTQHYVVDVWVTDDGNVLTHANPGSRVRGGQDGKFSSEFLHDNQATSRPYGTGKRRDQRVKPAGELLLAVRAGTFPAPHNAKWGRDVVTDGLSNGVQVTAESSWRNTQLFYDLPDALRALSGTHTKAVEHETRSKRGTRLRSGRDWTAY